MPTLTRWFIKSSLIYLIAALILGLVLALRFLVSLPPFVDFMGPAYFHLFMVGWVTQMIFGVVYWMFPIITREQPRGSLWLGWAVYGLLNVGLLLRVLGEPLVASRPEGGFGWLLVVSAVLQWVAGLSFVINSWSRVKGKYRGE